MKIVKYFEESGLLIKGFSETIENEKKEQRGGFADMLLDTLGANFLRNVLSGKGVVKAANGTIRAEEKKSRPGQDF